MAPMICINKKSTILFFLIISTLFLSNFSDGRTNVVKLANQEFASAHQEVISERNKMEEERMIKERILRANHRDYGHYDPAPALVRPPFKLIPN